MDIGFEKNFQSLTGHSPMKWQRRLYHLFLSNKVPNICDIPTGLGKTSVIVIWLLALAEQARNGQVRLARRLVYVVNRRTVVDQATTIAERVRLRLLNPAAPEWRQHEATLVAIAAALRRLCASFEEIPLALSTLRGELADNEEWKADPARAAIVIGTIDMIGSKLLFSGYGDGAYNRAHHAGLIGQDTLFVHDEAHLTPAFGDLLRNIAEVQRHSDPKPFRVLELSATSRNNSGEGCFQLEAEDREDQIVQERLRAAKSASLHRVSESSLIDRAVELGKRHEESSSKVLIYVRTPERAQEIADKLAKILRKDAANRIAILTGTIRGHERDQLVKTNRVYRAFLEAVAVEKAVYLVSTSAGEVGIDLDADHMICDSTTLDAMIQRLGRVNRRGGQGRCARIDVVAEVLTDRKWGTLTRCIYRTLALVRLARLRASHENAIDVSLENLCNLLNAAKPEWVDGAFSPKPKAPILTDILLDSWSLTSIDDMPGRPEVETFLHGVTPDAPETFVAWRREVTLLSGSQVDESSLCDWFRTCRIEARERLRDRTDRVRDALANLLMRHRTTTADADFPVVVLNERGRAALHRLSEIIAKDFNLAFRTVVLPIEACGLSSHGMLDATVIAPPKGSQFDVAEEGASNGRQRWLHRRGSDGERYEWLLTGEIFDHFPADLREKERVPLLQPDEADEDGEALDLLLLVSPFGSSLETPETASGDQTLAEHTDRVVAAVSAIANCINLPEPKAAIQAALIAAAGRHDTGKDRRVWQRYARNPDPLRPLAKAKSYLHPRALGGYRHEFGSLLEALADEELQRCSERDLMLHLIAAHHGWARPHFEPRSFDSTYPRDQSMRSAYEAMRRFEQLQRRFGRWGLAWLESLLRCADIAASREMLQQRTVAESQGRSS